MSKFIVVLISSYFAFFLILQNEFSKILPIIIPLILKNHKPLYFQIQTLNKKKLTKLINIQEKK